MKTTSSVELLQPAEASELEIAALKALADPVRLSLLTRISRAPEVACTDLVDESAVTASTISYHMKTLKMAGLVDVRKDGRNFHYRLKTEVLESIRSLLGELTASASS